MYISDSLFPGINCHLKGFTSQPSREPLPQLNWPSQLNSKVLSDYLFICSSQHPTYLSPVSMILIKQILQHFRVGGVAYNDKVDIE